MKTRRRAIIPALLVAASAAWARPAAVDLGRWQTPIRDQGGRGNCFIHATVAAMEAAYKRAGYGDLDLSELFSDYMGQIFFLETVRMDGRWYTSAMRVPVATERETSIQSDHAMTVESASPCMILAIPEEPYMPYRRLPADLGGHTDKNDPFWANQYTVSSFNLDPSNLPYAALSAPRYYRIRAVEWLPKDDARNPAAMEAVLAAGREVIWDFRMAGDISGKVWRYNGPAGDAYPHRMLIIGYNRTDPRNPYFLVKNSWADVGVYDPRDRITRIHYDYLQYGEWASYIKEIEAPRPWPELQFIGRWRLELGPRSGILDLYHLPGMMRNDFEHNQFRDELGRPLADRRLGTFYAKGDPQDAYRVNGDIRGNRIELYIDFNNPSARWDLLQGWKISFSLDPRDPHRLAGRYDSRDGLRGEARAERNRASISPIAVAKPEPSAGADTASLAREEMEKRKRWDAESVERAERELKRQAEEQFKLAENERLKKEANAPEAESPILFKWRELGGPDGFLGAAQTDEQICPDGRGHYIHFAGGSIYWTPEHGAFEVHGLLRDKWASLGWETGPLGYPVSDVQLGEDKETQISRFERGLLREHPARAVQVELFK